MDTDRGLNLKDLKTFRIGQITEAAVRVDSIARQLLAALQREDPSSAWTAPRQVTVTLKKASWALRARDDLDPKFVADGEAAIAEAMEAYEERSRYVHDPLIRADSEAWDRVKLDAGRAELPQVQQVTLADIDSAHIALLQAGWRLLALKAVVTSVNDGAVDQQYRSSMLPLLSGPLEVDEDGASWTSADESDD